MKIFLFSTSFTVLILAIFYCNSTLDPKQVSISDLISGDNLTKDFPGQSRLSLNTAHQQFTWQPSKIVVIPLGKSLSLTGPTTLDSTGDISWVANEGTYAALKPAKVQFYKLGIVDINSITTKYLSTLEFNSDAILSSPVSTASNPNNLPVNTVIACKAADGKYYLLEVAKVNWGTSWGVQLSVYQAEYALA